MPSSKGEKKLKSWLVNVCLLSLPPYAYVYVCGCVSPVVVCMCVFVCVHVCAREFYTCIVKKCMYVCVCE